MATAATTKVNCLNRIIFFPPQVSGDVSLEPAARREQGREWFAYVDIMPKARFRLEEYSISDGIANTE
jgi:hypothetical protein